MSIPTNPTYAQYVDAQIPHNSCLKRLAEFLHGLDGNQIHATKISSVDFSKSGCQNLQSWTFHARGGFYYTAPSRGSATLQPSEEAKLHDMFSVPYNVQGRIVIIEDMDRHIASFLGARYDISPFFFANHLDNSFSDFEERPPLASLTIPSIHCKGDSIHLHYRRVIDLGTTTCQSLHQMCTDSNVSRSVKVTPQISARSLGWARSCCSMMKKRISKDQWICLVFIDPTNAKIRPKKGSHTAYLEQIPIHGGPKLELGMTEFSQWKENNFNPSAADHVVRLTADRASQITDEPSLRDILVQCFRQPSPDFDEQDPSLLSLAYYPIQIVISEWNFYTMLLSRYVKHYEYAIISSEASVQLSNLEELLPWRRRCVRSQQRLHLLYVFIDSHLQNSRNEELKRIWKPILQDINHFSSQIGDWASFLGSMVTQLDTHQALVEARSVRRFTYVVLAFTALSLVTSIFSMTDEVLPWGSRFWIYIVIAVPFTFFVLLGYFTLSKNLGRA